VSLRETLPPKVTVYEVGPRDGLQNEHRHVSTEVKVELIARLVKAGLSTVEATSFVHPKWVPQLADAEDVMASLNARDGIRYPVLVPNPAGLERAIRAGAREVAIFGAATESFARRNLDRTIAESLAMFAPVVRGARDIGIRVRGYISMAFGDPWEGEVSPSRVADVAGRMCELGVDELSVGDTIGVATPAQVERVLGELDRIGIPAKSLAVHFHDTYGQGLANVLLALEMGIAIVDSAVGGLGGCPFAQVAAGNLATEDLVYMLHGLGIETGIDLDAVVATAWWIAAELGRQPASRVSHALRDRVETELP
jgi:hydroxymethylglutaryl-CoA lyase